jgi:hypothetical protein
MPSALTPDDVLRAAELASYCVTRAVRHEAFDPGTRVCDVATGRAKFVVDSKLYLLLRGSSRMVSAEYVSTLDRRTVQRLPGAIDAPFGVGDTVVYSRYGPRTGVVEDAVIKVYANAYGRPICRSASFVPASRYLAAA